MSAVLMDGKALAARVKEEVRAEVSRMRSRPGLAVILVGDDPASRVYVDGKRRDCAQCGIYSEEYALPAQTDQASLLALVSELNGREDIDGILIQLPLPAHLRERELLDAVLPDRDVDGFHPVNAGRLMNGEPGFRPCTPLGVMRMLEEYRIDPAGRNCVIVGRSNLVGKPLALMLLASHATVTVCHTGTADLAAECRRADILITAAGSRGLITADMIRPGAVVIDVSMNRDPDGRLCGDADFPAVREKASFLTPVPGGVGPMTRAMLLVNTVQAARMHGKSGG